MPYDKLGGEIYAFVRSENKWNSKKCSEKCICLIHSSEQDIYQKLQCFYSSYMEQVFKNYSD